MFRYCFFIFLMTMLLLSSGLNCNAVVFADTTVDNLAANTSMSGSWSVSGGSDPFDPSDTAADSLWARGGDDTFTWFFSPLETGTYEVWEWHTGWSSRTNAASHLITHADGDMTVLVDQKVNAGRWNSIGVFPFVAGQNYAVTVTSTVGNASTCADAMRWTLVSAGNLQPSATIQAITPNPANEGDIVIFTGSGSDSDGTIAAYQWNSDLEGTLSGDASFSTANLSVGTHTIALQVQDDGGAWSDPVTQTLTIKSLSQEIIRDNQDSDTSQTGSWGVSGGSNPFDPGDPDADSVWARGGDDTFSWHFTAPQTGNYEVWEWHSGWSSRTSAAPHMITYDGGSANVTVNQQIDAGQWNSMGVYPFVAGERYLVTVTSVADGSSTSADAMRWTFVSSGNSLPTASIESITPNPASDGETVTLTGSGSDTDGSITAYQWNSSLDGELSNNVTFTTSTLSVGTHTIAFQVQDNDGDWSVPVTRVLTNQAIGTNNPPIASIVSIAPNPAGENEAVAFTGNCEDTDGTVTTFRWTSSINGTLSNSEAFSTSALDAGTHTITFQGQDDDGAWSNLVTQDLTINGAISEVIRDNGDLDTSQTGTWETSGAANPFDPIDPTADSLWARGGDDTYSWYITAPRTGTYEVWEWHTGWASRTNAAPHLITYAGGQTTISVDQSVNAGQWNSLGMYPFEAGQVYRVTVTSVAGSASTCADAIRWTPDQSGIIKPVATIDAISPNPAYEGQPINFSGHGSDLDGTITGYRWSSSIDGILNYNDAFYSVDLSPATHTISFEVQDNDGNWSATATMNLTVSSVSVAEEHIYYCMGFGGGVDPVKAAETWLEKNGAEKVGGLWQYTNSAGKKFIFHFILDQEGMRQALMTNGAHVLYRGHANYGLGAVFPTPEERVSNTIYDIYTIDDPKIFNVSSPWIHVSVRGIRTSQAYPNWWPMFQDGTSGILPYDFGETAGTQPYYFNTPPYNYYITYQIPGDPTGTHYLAESVNNGGIERFVDSQTPAWYAADGSKPDPTNPEHLQYFITNSAPWAPSLAVRGDWVASVESSGFYRDDYLYSPAGTGLNEAEYMFEITDPGDYMVSAWWPEAPAHTASAKYVIHHGSGSTEAFINQQTNGGQWNEVGVYYFDAGDYSVVINDDTASGRVVADGIRVTALANPDPVIQADFNAATRYGPAPLDVTFDSESTGDITSFEWNLGDGDTNTTRTYLTHTYANPGTYTIRLTVNGADGTSTVTRPGYIIVGNVEPPLKAEFSGNNQQGVVPLESSFNDLSSGNIVSWSWDFDGDGLEDSTDQNPVYTYTMAGNYTVGLTVTDGDGNTFTEEKSNFVLANVYEKSIDNVDYPKTHFGSKTMLFRKDLDIPKEALRYKRLFYESCNAGNYYLDTFNHGVVFYTLNTSNARGFWTYVKTYMDGKSNQEIWERMQRIDPVYDYYDFNKLPSQQ